VNPSPPIPCCWLQAADWQQSGRANQETFLQTSSAENSQYIQFYGLPLQYKSACPREWDDYLMSLSGLPTTNYSCSQTAEHSQFLSPWVEDHLYPLVMILLEMIEYVTIPGLEKSTHVVMHWQIVTHTHLVELPVQMFCSCCNPHNGIVMQRLILHHGVLFLLLLLPLQQGVDHWSRCPSTLQFTSEGDVYSFKSTWRERVRPALQFLCYSRLYCRGSRHFSSHILCNLSSSHLGKSLKTWAMFKILLSTLGWVF
jgi:hypothetical protein